jgi:hypothetical protein
LPSTSLSNGEQAEWGRVGGREREAREREKEGKKKKKKEKKTYY